MGEFSKSAGRDIQTLIAVAVTVTRATVALHAVALNADWATVARVAVSPAVCRAMVDRGVVRLTEFRATVARVATNALAGWATIDRSDGGPAA